MSKTITSVFLVRELKSGAEKNFRQLSQTVSADPKPSDYELMKVLKLID